MSDKTKHRQLGAQDAQFVYSQTPSNLTHVMAVGVFAPPKARKSYDPYAEIIKVVKDRIHVSPVFRRKLHRAPMDIDHPYWVEDEHFDLEAHITHSKLPRPAEWQAFAGAISRHFSRPMDLHRPLWDIHILEDIDHVEGMAPGSFAVIQRVHHSATDGMGMTRLMAALSDSDAKGTPLMPLETFSEAELGQRPATGKLLSRSLRNLVSAPLRMGRSLAGFAPEIMASARSSQSGVPHEEPRQKIPETRFNGGVSPHKLFDGLIFPLENFKLIKSAVDGATVNDAVLAVTGGALRTYLKKHDELPEASLVAWCPVNVSKDPEQGAPGANNLSGMSVAIGTGIADPIERLTSIRAATASAKAAESGVGARMLTELTQHIPSAGMAGLARLMSNESFAPKFCNLFVSNVPGSPVPLYMAGAKCSHQFGLAPLGNGMGLFMAVGSYNGKLVFNIISDRKILPDMEFFRECLQASHLELLEAAKQASKTREWRQIGKGE
jgi:WS/DGAT/MGAT family acyltransferase